MTLLQSPLKPMRPLQRSSNLSVLSIAVPSASLWLPSDPPWWSPALPAPLWWMSDQLEPSWWSPAPLTLLKWSSSLPAPWWSSDQDGGSHGAWLSICFSFFLSFFLLVLFFCLSNTISYAGDELLNFRQSTPQNLLPVFKLFWCFAEHSSQWRSCAVQMLQNAQTGEASRCAHEA